MVADFWRELVKIGIRPIFCALAFDNGLENRNKDVVNFAPVTREAVSFAGVSAGRAYAGFATHLLYLFISYPRRPHTRLYLRPAHTGRRHTNTLVAARLQQRQPLSSTDGAAILRPCILYRCTACVESVADN